MKDEYISREAAIDAINRLDIPEDMCVFEILSHIELELGTLPSAQPERIRGRWIEKPHVHGVAYCSLCDYELHTNDTNFCPNCGAYMGDSDDKILRER